MLTEMTRTLPAMLSRVWDFLLDIVYPPRCGGCERRGTLLCDDCRLRIVHLELDAGRVERIGALICGGAFGGPLREAIHRLKYESDSPLARPWHL